MNKTQDKFSLPAVTLSIFAARRRQRLTGMQFAPGSPLAGGAGCSTADRYFLLWPVGFGSPARQSLPPGQLHFACRSG